MSTGGKPKIPGGKTTNKLIKVNKDDTTTKRLQYLQNRKAQSISGQVDSIANGQTDKVKKHKDKLESTVSSGFSRNDSLKCLNDNITLFKLKSELLEYKTKTEKLQIEINV
jgi:hypothetical protein